MDRNIFISSIKQVQRHGISDDFRWRIGSGRQQMNQGLFHGNQGGMPDVSIINNAMMHYTDGYTSNFSQSIRTLVLVLQESSILNLLGGDWCFARRQDNGSGNHRAGQASAAHLIKATNHLICSPSCLFKIILIETLAYAID